MATVKLKLNCGSNPINSVTFSSNGERLASASDDGTIRLWDTNGTVRQTFQSHPESVVNFSQDSELLVSASCDEPVQLWNVANGTVQQTLQIQLESVSCVTFSPSGEVVLASGDEVQFWNTADGTVRHKTLRRHDNVSVLPRRNRARHLMLEGYPSIGTLAFSPKGRFLACGYDDGMLKLWDISTERVYNLEGHSNAVIALAFSSDGEIMASASHDGKIWLWDMRQAGDEPNGYKPEGQKFNGCLAPSQFDVVGTIVALTLSTSSCSIRAGIINPPTEGSHSITIYEARIECLSSKYHP